MYKKLSPFIVLVAALNIIFVGAVWAQEKNSPDGVWRKIDESALAQRGAVERWANPARYETFRVNREALNEVLDRAPREFSDASRSTETVFTIPMPNGGFERFRIENSPIMERALAEKYPEIQSFTGRGIDNPTATVRFDISPNGFRAQILSNQGTIFVEPFAKGDTTDYISFYKSDAPRNVNEHYCLVGGDIIAPPEEFKFIESVPEVTNGTQLRIYRLALAATGEYTAVFGGTVAGALAAMNTTMNRVNGVYEKELALRMVLVANNDLIIYTNGSTDPYTNNSGSTMLGENTTNLNNVIGTANYDIGHVFSTGGGGVATLNGPCGASKARGVTGLPNPTGDLFAIDFVAHEMGHQFGGSHTFNAVQGNCTAGTRSAANSYEPGSGVTIMGYAGICGTQDLADNSIDNFHVRSLEQIVTFINAGGNCSVNTPTGNTPPSINAVGGTSWNIPKQTPFALTASATDANGDTVTYDWQQYDTGGATGTNAIPNTDADGTARPLFRSYLPVTTGTRYFPSLQYIRNNANVPPSTTGGLLTGELLPAITRTMNFQAIARDNRVGGGAVNTVSVQVNVDGNSGPFVVTAPNTGVNWTGFSSQTVTWNVANTNNAPVSAANVKISLSTDGGLTFPTTVVASTANDGSETITVPNVGTSQGRIKVEGVNNIFFDISDANFTITPGAAARKRFDFDGDGRDDLGVFRPTDGNWYLLRSQTGFTGVQFGLAGDKTVVGDYDGDGKEDVAVFRAGNWYWLNSSNGAFNAVQFGIASDQPVTGDFDGDGRHDQAVFRNGTWYIRQSGSGGSLRTEAFGIVGDKPVTGDFDGDNKDDVAVYRNGTWFLLRSQAGFTGVQFGIATDAPTPADYDGDNITDLAVYRSGTWYLLRSQLGFTGIQFGIATDTPVPGDYDGDGKADVAVFRGSNGTWYQQGSASGFGSTQFGATNDLPVSAPLY